MQLLQLAYSTEHRWSSERQAGPVHTGPVQSRGSCKSPRPGRFLPRKGRLRQTQRILADGRFYTVRISWLTALIIKDSLTVDVHDQQVSETPQLQAAVVDQMQSPQHRTRHRMRLKQSAALPVVKLKSYPRTSCCPIMNHIANTTTFTTTAIAQHPGRLFHARDNGCTMWQCPLGVRRD